MASTIPTSVQSADDATGPGISYSGSWTAVSNCVGEYDGTMHSTTEVGASATFTFDGFNAVGAILSIPAGSGSVVGSWTRDGVTGKVEVPCTSDVQENYQFYPYTASSLFGPDTIVVRNAGTVPFQLDRFIVGNITNNTPSSNTPDTPSSTTTSSISTTAVTSSGPVAVISSISQGLSSSSNSTVAISVATSGVATAGIATALDVGSPSAGTFKGTSTSVPSSGVFSPKLTAVSNNTPSSSPRSLFLGPIIGGVLGALALILLFIFALIRCRPRKGEKSNQVETVPSSTLTPFIIQATPVGHVGSDDKKALAIAGPSLPSSTTTEQSSQISLPRPQSDVYDNPTANLTHFSQEKGPLDPASPSTLTPQKRTTLVPSYSPEPNRRYSQPEFSNVSAGRASALVDVPPAYDNLNIPLGSSQAQPIP